MQYFRTCLKFLVSFHLDLDLNATSRPLTRLWNLLLYNMCEHVVRSRHIRRVFTVAVTTSTVSSHAHMWGVTQPVQSSWLWERYRTCNWTLVLLCYKNSAGILHFFCVLMCRQRRGWMWGHWSRRRLSVDQSLEGMICWNWNITRPNQNLWTDFHVAVRAATVAVNILPIFLF